MSVLHLDSSNFDSTVSQGKNTLVDFWAPWCAPCRMLGPTIDKLAEEVGDKAVVAKVDVDQSPDIAQRYGINTIPTILFFKKGELVSMSGPSSLETLKKTLLNL